MTDPDLHLDWPGGAAPPAAGPGVGLPAGRPVDAPPARDDRLRVRVGATRQVATLAREVEALRAEVEALRAEVADLRSSLEPAPGQ